ncbi:phosphoglycerate kinase [Aeropyrum pernix K1]|uniref:Phosphoglycerate kinase n=1 Tax=Aeropyrum pernix (strain ATCC 700893 / DSM 11879 / JCM 9820 / NBRC 100138 / K1) TaxID=272557 RepID=PGK_AERPE|nr:phosphoglycerate kinase [Aeropyrum pernix]Q9YFS7.2 RecName: Full=Phosphoglycerate kinase [Aeropyrum pernix K1]BAA79084.2 phosphoglycerate kinase [Aeropyrum pernix K1]
MPLEYMGGRLATLDDVDVRGKKVIVRFDLNSPVGNGGEILDDSRIAEAAGTLRELCDRGAAVVALSHQGRPLESDFVSLERHASLLSRYSGVEVRFVMDVIGPEALRTVASLRPGEAVLLDNTRIISEDFIEAEGTVHARGIMVTRLSKLANMYVNEAFSASHRSQASIVGFPYVLPSAGGRVLEKEIRSLNRAVSSGERPKVVVLGGAKLKDAVRIVDYLSSSGVADEVLTTGLVGLLFLYARGYRLPRDVTKLLEKKGGEEAIAKARRIVEEGRRVRTPIDFVVEVGDKIYIKPADELTEGVPKDIGPSTVEYFRAKMRGARVIVMRGPAGVIEDPRFRRGTVELVKAALSSGAYTVFGGGHFRAILRDLPEHLSSKVGHLSTGGGALLYYLSGRPLPGVKALVDSARIFNLV